MHDFDFVRRKKLIGIVRDKLEVIRNIHREKSEPHIRIFKDLQTRNIVQGYFQGKLYISLNNDMH